MGVDGLLRVCRSCLDGMIAIRHRLHVHRVTAVGKVEVLLLLLGVAGAEAEVALLVDLGPCLAHVLSLALLIGEVLLDDVVCLHVDLLVGVVLALVDLLHAADFFDEQRVAIDRLTSRSVLASLLVHVADLQDVLQTVEGDLDDLVVWAHEQIAQRLDAAALYEVADLGWLLETTRCGVRDGPAGLFPGLEVAVLEEVDQGWDDVGIDDSLDLGGVASGDVGNGPASLLTDAVLGGAQQREQGRERAAVDDDLSLHVVAGDNVADRAQGRGLDGGGGVHEQLYEAAWNASLDNGLDLVVGAVGEVRDGPARIDEDLVVERVHELSEDGQRGLDLLEVLAAVIMSE